MFYTSALWSSYTCSVETLEIQVYLNEIFKKILILTKSGLCQKQSNSSSKVLRQRKSISEWKAFVEHSSSRWGKCNLEMRSDKFRYAEHHHRLKLNFIIFSHSFPQNRLWSLLTQKSVGQKVHLFTSEWIEFRMQSFSRHNYSNW